MRLTGLDVMPDLFACLECHTLTGVAFFLSLREDTSMHYNDTASASALARKLIDRHHLETDEYRQLIEKRDEETARMLAEEAVRIRKEIYGSDVFIRGLIEVSNICRNDCLYCGIRRSNACCDRYRLGAGEILASRPAAA